MIAALTGCFALSKSTAQAQTLLAPTGTTGFLPGVITLRDGQDNYSLGLGSAVTRDDNRRVIYNDLIARHLAGRSGVVTDHAVLPLGTTGAPHWIIMAVKNETTAQQRWVLSLGGHSDGRNGVYNRLFVYDQLAGQYLLYAMPDRNGVAPKAATLPLNGNGIPFVLLPGTQALLALYIVPDAGAPVTLAPHLMTEQAFWRSQSLLSTASIVPLALILAIGYFAGLLVLRRSLVAVPVMAYLTAQLLLYQFQDTAPYSTFPLASDSGPVLLFLCVICGTALSKFFFGVRGGRENIIILIVIGTGVVLNLIGLFALPATGLLHALTLLGVAGLGLLFLCLFSLAQTIIGKPAAALMTCGWLVLLGGFIIATLAQMGTLSPTLPAVNAYWIAMLAQCTLLILSSLARLWAGDVVRERADTSQAEDSDAIERIRQARENSENARLLKVIEHERSILQELRDREVQQNEDMRRAKEGADLANRAKSAFLAVISHEIRTPMSGIMGMVRLLLDTTLTKDQNDYARTIQDSGDAMLALLNDILDFEKIESGKMDLEIMDFDLLRLINDITTLMSGHASHKGIELKTEIDPGTPRYVRGDPVRLRQVLLNLTGNAIKFTSDGSVVLALKVTPDAAGRPGFNDIYFGVRDSGIGLSPESQKNLFNPFSQADNSVSRKYGGTGLGLAISQRLIETMGGKIMIDSEEGQGSTFFFTIGMETGQAERVEDISSALASRYNAKTEKSLNVLCVDDNDINRKLLKEFVSRMGHSPTLAATGEQALHLMKMEKFDAVLMDIELPGISGMGATRAIRAMPDKERAMIPVIALTGNVRDEDIRACYAANMNGHLAKPIEPEKMKAQLDKVISGRLDNPVSLDQIEAPTSHAQEMRISDHKTADADILSFADDHDTLPPPSGNMPSIRAYALQTEPQPIVLTPEELNEDSFTMAMNQIDNKADDQIIFDHKMLDGLKDSMKPADLLDMVGSLTDKNDEIIAALQMALEGYDAATLTARAHELKGMAGNFGLKALAALADKIEKIARTNTVDGIDAIVTTLPAAGDDAKAALKSWMDEH